MKDVYAKLYDVFPEKDNILERVQIIAIRGQALCGLCARVTEVFLHGAKC